MDFPAILKSNRLYFAILVLFVVFILSIPLSFVLRFLVGPYICLLPLLLFVIFFVLGVVAFVKNILPSLLPYGYEPEGPRSLLHLQFLQDEARNMTENRQLSASSR